MDALTKYCLLILIVLSSKYAYSQSPSIVISNNGTQIAATDVAPGTSKHILQKIAIAASNADANITSLTVTTTGNYIASDITSIEAIYSSDATIDNFDFAMSTYVNPGTANSKAFPLFSGAVVYQGTTGYIFVVANISCTAGAGRYIGCNGITGTGLGTDAIESGSSSNGGWQTFVTPAVQLGDNNQITAANIAQGATNHILNSIFLRVSSTTDATLTGMTCTTAGDGITNYQSADLTNLKVWYSSDATWSASDVLLSTFTTPGAPGNKTFPSFTSQKITSGTYAYIFITADLPTNAVANRKIRVNALTSSNFTFTCTASFSGFATAGGIQTITAPSISIGNNVAQPSNANVSCGTTAHVLHKTTITVSNAAATLTAMQCFVVGTYQTADITNLKVRYSTDATLDASDATLSTITNIATGSASVKKVFSPFTSQQINVGAGYIFITADIASSATTRNININSLVAVDFTFVVGTPSVTTAAGGSQTFVVPGITIGNNGSQPGNASVAQGTTGHVLQKITLTTNSTGIATLSGLNCTTTGNYNSTDIVNLKAIYSANSTLDAGDITLSTITNPTTVGAQTFPSFISQTIAASTTGYLFITADIFPAASGSRTISINGLTSSNVLFNGGTVTGSSSNCGTQTFSGINYTRVISVSSNGDSGAGTLRQAISDANGSAGRDYISFNLGSSGGPFTITLSSTLTLTDNSGVTIDGFTNAGNNGTASSVSVFNSSSGSPINHDYKVILANSGTVNTGIAVNSNNNIIKGLVLQDFGDGTPGLNDITISISGSSNQILGCTIGLDYLGTTCGTKPYYGIYISGGSNNIGDGTAAGANVISGMNGNGYGIYMTSASATNNTIKGNIIGLQRDGTTIVTSNAQDVGIGVDNNVGSGNVIGGTNSGDGNVISGNGTATGMTKAGIMLYSTSNPVTVQGNIIGLCANGTTLVTGNNQNTGIALGGNGNTIGGNLVTYPNAKNIISGNRALGISLSGSSNIIKGNYIGCDITGSNYIANNTQYWGINNYGAIVSAGINNTIGGTTLGDGNVISGNAISTEPSQSGGIWIQGQPVGKTANITVAGNIIGLAANGTSTLSGQTYRQMHGVYIMNVLGNTVGGNTAAARNIISGNKSTGIYLPNDTDNNVIKGNYIGPYSNGTSYPVGATQTTGISLSDANNNTIGGSGAGEGNLISGNSSEGILVGNYCSNTSIKGNILGLQSDGASFMTGSLQLRGIYLAGAQNTTIGGTTAAERNIISGNDEYGIRINNSADIATNNTISGNYIGPTASLTDVTGDSQESGIYIWNSATNTTIGGTAAGAGNVIAFHTGDGIYITGASTTGHTISRNLIYSNGATSKAINLDLTGTAGNSGKSGVTFATWGTSSMTGTSGANDIIELFVDNASGAKNTIEYLGTTTANASGEWSFTVPRSHRTLDVGEYVVATATAAASRNTSELRGPAGPVTLPIELLQFEAKCNSGSVEINWTTATETNNDYFTIERTSDGINDKKEFTIKGSGTTTNKTSYSFTDKESLNGMAYYRLKQTDFDGKFEYFHFVSVDCEKQEEADLNVFPNPNSGMNFNMSLPISKDTEVVVVVYDVNGRESYSKVLVSETDGSNIFAVDMENKLTPGLYVIVATSNKKVYKKRLIVK